MPWDISLVNQVVSCQIATFGKLRTAFLILAAIASMVALGAMQVQGFLLLELLLALPTFIKQVFVRILEVIEGVLTL